MEQKNMDLTNLVAERIKNTGIGELIKEEDLYDITKEAMNKALFTPQRVPNLNRGYSQPDFIEKDPLIVATIKEQIGDLLRVLVRQHIQELEDDIQQVFQEQLAEKMQQVTVEKLVMAAFEGILGTAVTEFKINLQNQTIDMLRNGGIS